MKKIKTLFITLFLSFVVLWMSVEGWAVRQFLTQPIPSLTENKVITVPKGASSRSVANLLFKEQIIHQPNWFVLYLKYLGKANQIKAGEFEIQAGWTLDELIDALIKGKTVTYPVTIIAGETFQQALSRIQGADKMQHQLGQMKNAELAKKLGIHGHLEGQLLPETYFYSSGDEDLELVKRSHRALKKILNEAWATREKGLPLKTPYEALILASIVEKETGYAPERSTIAGVFVNRLRKGMRLQSDPTVIYGMGEKYDGNIRKKDLQTKTPYNTYRINGLPPTPIALASADAIRAVMHPAKTDALYFVANGDGQHRFSKTLKEHNRAVRDYLRKLKQQR